MSSITVEPRPASPAPSRKPAAASPLVKVGQALASLRLTVILFVLSFLLVFLGTLAQIDHGIWTVVSKYFRSFLVFIPLNVFLQFAQIFFGVPKEWSPGVPIRLPGSFPYPGGWTLAIALMVNLVAAHLVRFKLSWKRAGILVTHAGLIVMLVGELITGWYAIEGNMVIEEGQTTDAVIENRAVELAVVDPSDAKTDTVTTVPRWMLQRKGRTVSHADLPFDVVPIRYMANSRLVRGEEAKEHLTNAGAGKHEAMVEIPEVSGVAADQTVDEPAVYVKLLKKGTDEEIGTYVFALRLRDQTVTVGDKEYDVSLRFKQTTRPFTLTLIKFTFDRYPGTDTPLNFASLVHLKDEQTGDDRDVTIRMNEPLRHRGETFYQANWNKETEKGTVLQVVRNPAWQLPYWSCAIVTIGLLMHFGQSLIEFLKKRGE